MDSLHENEYLTISAPSEGFFKDRGSKFLGFSYPFQDEEELKEIINQLKKEHHSARHFCFAYRVNPTNITERANDDGEPGHSAGTPILGQIQSKQLIDVLVVVVRYFGGQKLGVPGLINAYKLAAADALQNAQINKKELTGSVKIEFEYADLHEVMRVIKKVEPRILKQNMHLRVQMKLSIRLDKIDVLKTQLLLVKSLTFIDL